MICFVVIGIKNRMAYIYLPTYTPDLGPVGCRETPTQVPTTYLTRGWATVLQLCAKWNGLSAPPPFLVSRDSGKSSATQMASGARRHQSRLSWACPGYPGQPIDPYQPIYTYQPAYSSCPAGYSPARLVAGKKRGSIVIARPRSKQPKTPLAGGRCRRPNVRYPARREAHASVGITWQLDRHHCFRVKECWIDNVEQLSDTCLRRASTSPLPHTNWHNKAYWPLLVWTLRITDPVSVISSHSGGRLLLWGTSVPTSFIVSYAMTNDCGMDSPASSSCSILLSR